MLLSATWLPPGPLLPPPAANLQPAACALPPGSLNGTILPVTSAPSRLHRNFCPIGQSESLEGAGVGGGEGSRRGGGEGRGERFSVWSCSRSARAVSPGSSRRETFPETRAHTAHPPRTAHPRSLAHTHAHTQPGRAGATDHFASAGTSRGAVGTHTPPAVRGCRLGEDEEWRARARTPGAGR